MECISFEWVLKFDKYDSVMLLEKEWNCVGRMFINNLVLWRMSSSFFSGLLFILSGLDLNIVVMVFVYCCLFWSWLLLFLIFIWMVGWCIIRCRIILRLIWWFVMVCLVLIWLCGWMLIGLICVCCGRMCVILDCWWVLCSWVGWCVVCLGC